ncbi:MAG: threonine/serine dehydratase [Pseudomonadota bacterium]
MTHIAAIRQAASRIKGHALVTPLLRSPFIDNIAGRRVWVKAECLQITGSFKFRGGWNAVGALTEQERTRGVLAYSSGNHAQGVANAATAHGVDATILMPEDAPAIKMSNTKALGAKVVTFDRATEDRDEAAARVDHNGSRILIKPFDNEHVIAGQGTVGLEIAAQAAGFGIETAEVLVCCGGGGLTSGIALALKAEAPGLKARPVEPVGFDDVARSLRSGEIEQNPSLSGSAQDAILTKSPGELTFPILKRLCAPGLTVSDEETFRAMALAAQYLHLVIEPGGAAALAASLFRSDQIEGDDVIVTASGGNVDTALFKHVLETYGSSS